MYARTYSNNYNEAVRLDYRDETNAMRKELYQLPEAMSLQQPTSSPVNGSAGKDQI